MCRERILKYHIKCDTYDYIGFAAAGDWKQIFETKKEILNDKDNSRVMKGTKLFKEFLYEGDFVDGKMDGKGCIYKVGGELMYKGEIKEGKICGYGVRIFPNGNRYEGFYKNAKKNGQGKLILKDYGTFEGGFLEDKREGYGIMVFKDGGKYQGEWKNDMAHGEGTHITADGSVKYVGGWQYNGRNGWGILENDRTVSSGTWKDNKLTGIAKIVNKNGNYYYGQIVNNVWNGKGVYNWADGKKYEGDFKNGKYNGYGIMSHDHFHYSGFFKNGLPHGRGTFVLRNIFRSVGYYKNGKRHGNSDFFDSFDKLLMSAKFSNGSMISYDLYDPSYINNMQNFQDFSCFLDKNNKK